MEQPRAAPMALLLTDLPDTLLARIMALLPCDDQARCASLSRRFAALLADGACRVRVCFDCSRAVLNDDLRETLLRRAGDHLREIDLGRPHPAERVRLEHTLDSMSDAQRAQLTTLRCSRRPWEARALAAEPVDDVMLALGCCPNLQLLETDVALTLDAAPREIEAELLRSLPRLRIGRLILDCGLAGRVAAYPPEQLAALCACCAELCVVGGVNAADIGALEAALSVGGAQTVSVTVNVSEDAADGVAALRRLALRPGVVALAVNKAGAEAVEALYVALCAPHCTVHALAFVGIELNGRVVDRLGALLLPRSGAPLRRLALRHFSFADEDDVEHWHDDEPLYNSQLTRLCVLLARAQALQELTLSSSRVSSEDAPALAMLVRLSRSLRCLDVSSCALGNDGVTALAAALSLPNARLEKLRISDVQGSPDGAKALAAMLRVNISLREFHALGCTPPADWDDPQQQFGSPWTAQDADLLLDAVADNATLRVATLPDSLYADAEGYDMHGYHTRELQAMLVRAEHPRSADVRFAKYPDDTPWLGA